MKFTIGTVSNSLDFAEDMNLIKSSILYADDIELIGMAEYAIYKYLPRQLNASKDLESLFKNFIPLLQSVGTEESRQALQQIDFATQQIKILAPYLQKKKHRDKKEILTKIRFNQLERQAKEQLESHIDRLASGQGTKELSDLVARKIVSVYDYGFNGFDTNELAGGYFANLMSVMKNSLAYPLFDKASTEAIRGVAQSKLLDIGNTNPEVLRHAGIASNILMTLPTLKGASVDELLALKKEYSKPLIQFRSAIYGFSEQIKSLPWDDDFQYDCLKLYNTQVAPSVAEINEVLMDTSVLKNLGKQILTDEEIRKQSGYVIGGLATAVTTTSSMVDAMGAIKTLIMGLSMIVVSKEAFAGFMKVASMAVKANDTVKEKREKATSNSMYYYYLASKL